METLPAADREHVNAVDRAMRVAIRSAGRYVQCRRGCTRCCIGVFDITALDAVRLARALRRLQRRRLAAAGGIVRRARAQWQRVLTSFPGDRALGVLSDNERSRRRLFARFGALPCAVLDPRTDACLLYRSRPLSCRTFGLPVRYSNVLLPPCRLNFTRAAPAEVAASTVEPDPEDVEGALLERLRRESDVRGDTIIPAALALQAWSAPGRRIQRGAGLTR